ncbi:hypothetical protein SS50377_23718 [Spironucleus salmonicida]|uniref:Uncharacterized protein n=1 Tax=Spironucleus salmonicida TaxID=348837 RepID=V6LNZ8_9EUKA|nr:hypothetical protein SS50377_23718 [Spironucleus salmonicida]|eukprot:EST46397.1 Hypothetical protein SS50377_13481 [Spironucleus salmonicida]
MLILVLQQFDFDDGDVPDWLAEMQNGDFPFFEGQKIGYDPNYDPDTDPEMLKWREEQKPPAFTHACYVSELTDITPNTSHFFFFYNSFHQTKNASLEALRALEGRLLHPLLFTDCGKVNFCEQLVRFTPLFVFRAACGEAVNAKSIAPGDVESFLSAVQTAGFYDFAVPVNAQNANFVEKFAGICSFKFTDDVQVRGEAELDQHIRERLGVRPGSVQNYGSCEFFCVFKGSARGLSLDRWKGRVLCTVAWEEWGAYASQEWYLQEHMLPVVVDRENELVWPI